MSINTKKQFHHLKIWRQLYWFQKYQIAYTHLTTNKQNKAKTVPFKLRVKCFVCCRLFSICNRCSGETTQAKYDCISIKTWGCFICMWILTVVLSYSVSTAKLPILISLFGRSSRGMGPNPALMKLEKVHYYLYNWLQPKNVTVHTSYCSKHTLLTASIHANNYSIYPKQERPPSQCTFLE